MSSIKYRPKIEYELGHISTIDNVKDKYPVDDTYKDVLAPKKTTEKNIESALDKMQEIKSIIHDRLKDSSIKTDLSMLDDMTKLCAPRYNDGDKLVNGGIITYQLYVDCKDDAFMAPVINEWEKAHSGIDGDVGAEVLPYILDIEDDLRAINDVIGKTLIYDDEISSYNDLKNQLSIVYRKGDADIEKIDMLRRSIYNTERKIELYKNMISIIDEYVKEVFPISNKIEKIINSNRAYDKDKLASYISGDNKNSKLKLLTYQGFKRKREDVFAKRHEFSNLYSKGIKAASYKDTITNSRLFLDVAMPIINDLASHEDIDPSISHIVDGISDVAGLYKQSTLNMKNILTATINSIDEHLDIICAKHEARMLYRNF